MRVTLGGAETGLHLTGDAGPRVLLSHCSLAHSGAWRGMIPHLGAVRAEALDLPGHGETEIDPARRPQRQAADALLAQMGEGPVHLVGHSFGGGAVLRAALDRPAAVASLTLIEPMMFFLLPEDSPVAIEEAAATRRYIEAERDGNAAVAAEEFMTLWGNGTPWAEVPQKLRDYAVARMPFVAASADDVAGRHAGQITLDEIAALDCPVTLIAGAESRPSAIAIVETIATRLSQRPHLVAGAGHMVPITHPGEVAAILRPLLSR